MTALLAGARSALVGRRTTPATERFAVVSVWTEPGLQRAGAADAGGAAEAATAARATSAAIRAARILHFCRPPSESLSNVSAGGSAHGGAPRAAAGPAS